MGNYITDKYYSELGPDLAAEAALAGGDDYELCFTASTENALAIMALGKSLDLQLHRVGKIISRVENTALVRVLAVDGQTMNLSFTGFDHFK